MARFTVRVQLRGVHESDDDYDTLHAEMKRRGFRRTIDGDTSSYEMPWGSYNYTDDASIDEVLDRAMEAVAKTRHKAGVLVTEGTRKWRGLKESA